MPASVLCVLHIICKLQKLKALCMRFFYVNSTLKIVDSSRIY